MKTTTEKEAEYIARKRLLIESQMKYIAVLVISNTVNHSKDDLIYDIELSIGNAMAGLGVRIYQNSILIENKDIYNVYWPFENLYFFRKGIFDKDVNLITKQLDEMKNIVKKYLKLNNKQN